MNEILQEIFFAFAYYISIIVSWLRPRWIGISIEITSSISPSSKMQFYLTLSTAC